MEHEEKFQEDTYAYCGVLRERAGREGGREGGRKGEMEKGGRMGRRGEREGGREGGREEMEFSAFASTCSKHVGLPSVSGMTWASY